MKTNLFSSLPLLRKGLMAATLSLAALGSNAFAAQEVQEKSFTSQEMGYNIPLTIDKFDTSKGTLNYIKFEISGTIEATLTVTNQSVSNQSYQLNTSATFRAQSESGISPTWIFATVTPFSDTSSGTIASGDTQIFNRSANSSSETTYFNGDAAIAGFSSAGGLETLEIWFRAQNQSSVFGDGSFSASTIGFGSGTVKVTYDYEAVPEPSTWAVIALGAGVLAVYRRRRAA